MRATYDTNNSFAIYVIDNFINFLFTLFYLIKLSEYEQGLHFPMSEIRRQYPLSQRKLKKQLATTRHKSEFVQYSPWNMIGQALTQRYSQKFAQICKQIRPIIKPDPEPQLILSPKYGLKRKILSFDKQKQMETASQQHSVLMPEPAGKKNRSCKLYSIQYQKQEKNDSQMQKGQISPIKCKQTNAGTYYIPSNSPLWTNSKFKSIYVKKNIRKINLNPQLKISIKKKSQKKQLQNINFRTRSKSYLNSNMGNGLIFKSKHKFKQEEVNNEKIFGPWLGTNQQDYL